MHAFLKFNKGVMKMPIGWRAWVMILMVLNLVLPLFFLNRLEAQVTLGAFLAAGMIMTILTALGGFTRLLGLGHILWLPLIYFLWTRLSHIPTDDFFGIWIRALMLLNAASLVLDTIDVIRYIACDRKDMVKGL